MQNQHHESLLDCWHSVHSMPKDPAVLCLSHGPMLSHVRYVNIIFIILNCQSLSVVVVVQSLCRCHCHYHALLSPSPLAQTRLTPHFMHGLNIIRCLIWWCASIEKIIVKIDTECPPGGQDHRWRSSDNQSVGSSLPVGSRWLWPGNRTFLEMTSMVVTWWMVAFWHSG